MKAKVDRSITGAVMSFDVYLCVLFYHIGQTAQLICAQEKENLQRLAIVFESSVPVFC